MTECEQAPQDGPRCRGVLSAIQLRRTSSCVRPEPAIFGALTLKPSPTEPDLTLSNDPRRRVRRHRPRPVRPSLSHAVPPYHLLASRASEKLKSRA